MIKKIIAFIDKNLLLGISLFLLVFIPLYPKWPLLEALPGYIVRVRLEDFLILTAFIVWVIYFLKGKIKLAQIPLSKPIIGYLLVGFLSVLSAIFITKTVYPELIQVAKTAFHFARRAEYFSLFFIFFSSIADKKQIKYFFYLLPISVLGVTIYGYGQKYLYWPVYSTMNREFSKGIKLYLTEHARVVSSFGGHYDLAAYIMLTLPILLILGFMLKNKLAKIGLFLISLAEFWLLILTASRTSFIAYLAAVCVGFLILSAKKGWLWSLSRGFIVISLSLFIMISFGDLSERFAHILKLNDLKGALTSPFKAPPVNGIALDENISLQEQLRKIAAKSDAPPSSVKPKIRPDDVYIDPYVSTETGALADGEGEVATVHADYSENALKYGLSTGIRLDALWPKAWAGFRRNPLLGSGYATLVKDRVWEFTQAESTDNDYLRLLGETGLLGFISFMLIFAVVISVIYKAFQKTQDGLLSGLFAAGIGITVGLLVNAIYIDVFESSKVAYTYWSIVGILLACASLVLQSSEGKKPSRK